MRIGQSRRASLVEAATNIAVGFGVALATQYAAFPLFDIHIGARDHISITIIFTVVSLVRGYFLRRLFNWWHLR